MTVYIEYLLLDNLIIDYLLLKATFSTTGISVKKGRLFLSALIGTFFAFVLPLLNLNKVILTIIKIAVGLLMTLTCTTYATKKAYYISTVIFFLYTFLVGGIITGVYNLLAIPTGTEVCVATVILPAYLSIKGVVSVVKFLYRRKGVYSLTYKTQIVVNGKGVVGQGFLDTGNTVFDGDNPVIFCHKSLAQKFFDMGVILPLKKITLTTIDGITQKTAFTAQKIEIYVGDKNNIYNNVTVCVTSDGYDGLYQIILNPCMLEVGYVKQPNIKDKKVS